MDLICGILVAFTDVEHDSLGDRCICACSDECDSASLGSLEDELSGMLDSEAADDVVSVVLDEVLHGHCIGERDGASAVDDRDFLVVDIDLLGELEVLVDDDCCDLAFCDCLDGVFDRVESGLCSVEVKDYRRCNGFGSSCCGLLGSLCAGT